MMPHNADLKKSSISNKMNLVSMRSWCAIPPDRVETTTGTERNQMAVLRDDAARRVLDRVRFNRRHAAPRAADATRASNARRPHVQSRPLLDRDKAAHAVGFLPMPRMRRDHG